jgi:hypothetical protein
LHVQGFIADTGVVRQLGEHSVTLEREHSGFSTTQGQDGSLPWLIRPLMEVLRTKRVSLG